MSVVYLVILLMQVIVIFSLFLFRALIPCVSPILPFTADREHFHWCDNSGQKLASSIGKHRFSVLWIEGQFRERFVSFLIDQVTIPFLWLNSQKLQSSCGFVISPSFLPLLQIKATAEKAVSRGIILKLDLACDLPLRWTIWNCSVGGREPLVSAQLGSLSPGHCLGKHGLSRDGAGRPAIFLCEFLCSRINFKSRLYSVCLFHGGVLMQVEQVSSHFVSPLKKIENISIFMSLCCLTCVTLSSKVEIIFSRNFSLYFLQKSYSHAAICVYICIA